MNPILLSPESKKYMEMQAGKIFQIGKTALEKYEKLKEDYPGWSFKDDARLYFFGEIYNHCTSTVLLILAVADCLSDSEWMKKRITARSLEDAQIIFDQTEKSIRGNCLIFGWGIAENAIRRIVTEIKNEPATGSIYNICLDFYSKKLNHIKTNEFMELINLVTRARNTMHNDGFYYPQSGGDIKLTYRGKSFYFKVGQQIDFVTWEFVQGRLEDLIDMFNDTVRCRLVASLPTVK